MADIDVLQIKATSNVASATKSLDTLLKRLERVKAACNTINSAFKSINTASANAKLNKLNQMLSNVRNAVSNFNTEVRLVNISSLKRNANNLASSLNRVSQAATNATNAVNNVNSATRSATVQNTNYRNSVNRVSNAHTSGLRSITTYISQLAILYMATKKVANVMSDWFKNSNDYIETLNLFNVTMRDTADSAYEYAGSVQKIMGIDISEWMNYQGTFQQLAKGFGVVSDQADVMSQNLTQLSYDLASFFNADAETAFDKLSSAMTGQVKGLRQFGIDTTIASLQEYALAKGINLSVKEMTQAQKSVLRYNYILEKSINIQGDMARTIATPANAMRIFNAQMTQFERAMGNIISCLVVEFIPYIQAFVMLIKDAANAIADFLGFELPEIDYSNLDDAVNSVEDVTDSVSNTADSIEDATKSAKEFKKQLMGFDELNILSSNAISDSSSNDSSDSTNNLPSDLGLGIPEYDFGLDSVSSQAEEIYKSMKDFFGNIGELWENFEGILRRIIEALALIWAVSKIVKFVSWIKTSTSVLGKLLRKAKTFKALDTLIPNIINGFSEGWNIATNNGEGFFKKFKSGITGARDNLSGLQKGIVTVATTLVASLSGYNLFYDLANGTLTWYNGLMDIVGAAAAIGVAFALTGPVGGIITVLGLVVGAIFGVQTAIQEAMDTAVNEAFYDGLGVSISTLSDSFSGVMTKIQDTYDKYNETFSEMSENKSNIEGVSGNIGMISSAMNNGVTDVQTGCSDILSAITQLKTDTKTQCDLIYESIYTACAGSFGDALKEAGVSTDALLELTALTASGMNEDAADILQQMTDITNSYKDGNITQEEYTEKLSSLQGKYNDIMGVTDEATQATTDFATSLEHLNDIDWENETQRNEAFEKIKSSASGAKDSINTYYDNLKESITELRDKYDKDTDEWNIYNKALGATDTARKEALENVNTQVNDFFDTVQENLVTSMGDMQDEIDEAWDNRSIWEKFAYGDDKERFTKDFLVTYQENIVNPISENIQTCMDEIGSNGETYADEAVEGIMSHLTTSDVGVWDFDYTKFDEAMQTEFEKIGKNSITGYEKGAESEVDNATALISGIPTDLQGAFKKADNQHSPSKDYFGFGVNSIQGYINGANSMIAIALSTVIILVNKIQNAMKQAQNGKFKRLAKEAVTEYVNGFNSNFTTIKTTWDNKITSLSSSLDNLFSVNAWRQRAVNASNALKNNLTLPNISLNLEFNTDVSGEQKKAMQALGLSGFPKFTWYTYAQGGFPSMGEMFIAREKGPEMVGQINNKTTVANNDQIVEGISAGVYKAVLAAMNEDGESRDITVNTFVTLDGEVVGKSAVKYHNNEVLRTGESPLLI